MTGICEYCKEKITWDGKFWVTGPASSVIPERNICQSPNSPDFRHACLDAKPAVARREYKCPLWFEHIADLIRELQSEGSPLASRLEEAARHDQHDNHHEHEFYDGCKWCDEERKEQDAPADVGHHERQYHPDPLGRDDEDYGRYDPLR